MAKKKIHIDELFRRELGDMKMPVDTNDWAAMQAQIAAEQDKRKRRALWWWFMGIALLLIVGSTATYYFLNSENSQSKNVTVENTTSTPSIETPKENITSNQQDIKTENTTANQQTDSKDIKPNDAETNSSDKPVNSSKKETKKELEELKTKRNNTGNGRKNIDKGSSNGQEGNANGNTTLPEKQAKPKVAPKPTITENKDSNDTKETITKVIAPDSSKSKVISSDSTKTNNDSLKQAKQEKTPKKGKDGAKPKLPPFSLGFSLGGTSNSFTADDNSTFGRILNSGNQPALGFNTLLSANYAIKNFEINSGLGINSITNSGSYNYTHQTKDSIPVLDPFNNIIGYFYTNFRDTTHNFNLTSRFTSITLPIGVSYKISLGDNAGLRLGANTTINYLMGASGDYINPFNLFKLDVGDNKDLFRTWNIGLGGSVGYYYQLNNGFTLEGSINYNTLTNGIFDNRIGTAIRPSSIGVNVGIRYNFKLR